MSPVHDVPCSYVYGDVTMAISIGQRTGADFGAADFVELGESLGVPPRATRRALIELVERVDLWLPELADLPFDRRTIGKLGRVIAHRRTRLTS